MGSDGVEGGWAVGDKGEADEMPPEHEVEAEAAALCGASMRGGLGHIIGFVLAGRGGGPGRAGGAGAEN